jgi:hypothetical protein
LNRAEKEDEEKYIYPDGAGDGIRHVNCNPVITAQQLDPDNSILAGWYGPYLPG